MKTVQEHSEEEEESQLPTQEVNQDVDEEPDPVPKVHKKRKGQDKLRKTQSATLGWDNSKTYHPNTRGGKLMERARSTLFINSSQGEDGEEVTFDPGMMPVQIREQFQMLAAQCKQRQAKKKEMQLYFYEGSKNKVMVIPKRLPYDLKKGYHSFMTLAKEHDDGGDGTARRGASLGGKITTPPLLAAPRRQSPTLIDLSQHGNSEGDTRIEQESPPLIDLTQHGDTEADTRIEPNIQRVTEPSHVDPQMKHSTPHMEVDFHMTLDSATSEGERDSEGSISKAAYASYCTQTHYTSHTHEGSSKRKLPSTDGGSTSDDVGNVRPLLRAQPTTPSPPRWSRTKVPHMSRKEHEAASHKKNVNIGVKREPDWSAVDDPDMVIDLQEQEFATASGESVSQGSPHMADTEQEAEGKQSQQKGIIEGEDVVPVDTATQGQNQDAEDVADKIPNPNLSHVEDEVPFDEYPYPPPKSSIFGAKEGKLLQKPRSLPPPPPGKLLQKPRSLPPPPPPTPLPALKGPTRSTPLPRSTAARTSPDDSGSGSSLTSTNDLPELDPWKANKQRKEKEAR